MRTPHICHCSIHDHAAWLVVHSQLCSPTCIHKAWLGCPHHKFAYNTQRSHISTHPTNACVLMWLGSAFCHDHVSPPASLFYFAAQSPSEFRRKSVATSWLVLVPTPAIYAQLTKAVQIGIAVTETRRVLIESLTSENANFKCKKMLGLLKV